MINDHLHSTLHKSEKSEETVIKNANNFNMSLHQTQNYDIIWKEAERRNQRSKFLIFFRLAESKDRSNVSSIPSPKNYVILVNQNIKTSELSVLKICSGGVQKTPTKMGTAT